MAVDKSNGQPDHVPVQDLDRRRLAAVNHAGQRAAPVSSASTLYGGTPLSSEIGLLYNL